MRQVHVGTGLPLSCPPLRRVMHPLPNPPHRRGGDKAKRIRSSLPLVGEGGGSMRYLAMQH